jgi:hypothetical protein
MRAFWASLAVGFVVLSVLADSGATTQLVFSGTVAEFVEGERIAITQDQTDGGVFRVGLSETTIYESRDGTTAIDPAAITLGVPVSVSFRRIAGDRRIVADRVRVLIPAPTP